jgi:hypothetical protein
MCPEAVQNADVQVSYLTSSLLPLAAQLLTISETAKAQGKDIIATAYHTLHLQACSQYHFLGVYVFF